jgi:tetratricopeptide (TPR) repeat protein
MARLPTIWSSSVSSPLIRSDKLLERAMASYRAGDRAGTRRVCEQILQNEPMNAQACNLLGVVSAEERRLHEAIALFRKALQISPDFVEAWQNQGLALLDFGYLTDALTSFDRMVALTPDGEAGLTLRAIALARMGRFEEAVLAYDRVVAVTGERADVAANRGIALLWSSRRDEAMANFDLAIALDPGLANAWASKALAMMLSGDLQGGARHAEWRWKVDKSMATQAMTRPLWLGETSIAGKTILLQHEQGLGDTLQFCRYACMADKAGARVILVVPETLRELMTSLPGAITVLSDTETLPDHDVYCPMMSLMLAFGTTLEAIPAQVPYLRADPASAAKWGDRLSHLRGHRIGLVWSGGQRIGNAVSSAMDYRRSLALTAFAPLANMPRCSFVSLQLGPPGQQAKSPPPGLILEDPTGELESFADTAAVVENLDLVISVDTAVAHLAGAMGKPVWLLNRFDTCWRWFLDRNDSPWYPTLRQFRQIRSGDWDDVIAQIKATLTTFTAADEASRSQAQSSPRNYLV